MHPEIHFLLTSFLVQFSNSRDNRRAMDVLSSNPVMPISDRQMKPHRKAQCSRRPRSLSHGRPPTLNKPTPSLSSKATRTLIRSHHQLHKARAQAVSKGDDAAVCEIDAKIAALGGLESYQLASKTGQTKERGGDTSVVLVEWLKPVLDKLRAARAAGGGAGGGGGRLRVLEVGALSTKNACSLTDELCVARIDLHSQEKGIQQQDFMERPLPVRQDDMLDVISLSLVLNYVPDPVTRGQMLKRTAEFLDTKLPTTLAKNGDAGEKEMEERLLPCVFLVLPAACVLNSRYFTEERLTEIMHAIGYERTGRKVTNKLIYYLWVLRTSAASQDVAHDLAKHQKNKAFRKEELNPGKTRNNFTVVLND